MSRNEIGALLSRRLPQCIIGCSINADLTLTIEVAGPDQRHFTIANIDRTKYHGEAGANRLVREILEEMVVVSRRSSNLD